MTSNKYLYIFPGKNSDKKKLYYNNFLKMTSQKGWFEVDETRLDKITMAKSQGYNIVLYGEYENLDKLRELLSQFNSKYSIVIYTAEEKYNILSDVADVEQINI